MFRGVLVTFPPERRGGKIVPVIIEGVPEKYGRFEIDNSHTAYRTMEHFDHEMSSRYERVAPCFGFDLESKTPEIEKVIFNDPATIVIWKDKTKTVVKCQEGDTYSPELGLAMCIAKKYLGNKGNFNKVFKKWIPEDEPDKKDTRPEREISVEEMRESIREYCLSRNCIDCPLRFRKSNPGHCFSSATRKEIIENYKIMMKKKR